MHLYTSLDILTSFDSQWIEPMVWESHHFRLTRVLGHCLGRPALMLRACYRQTERQTMSKQAMVNFKSKKWETDLERLVSVMAVGFTIKSIAIFSIVLQRPG